MTLLGAPGADCASELCTMIDGEKQGLCFFFGGGKLLELFSHSDENHLQW